MPELQAYEPMGVEGMDAAWRDSVRPQFAANVTEERTKARHLAEIIHRQRDTIGSDRALFDHLPQTAVDVTRLPEDHQPEPYDVLHLQIRYNALTDEITLYVTLDADTVPALAATTNRVVGVPSPRSSPETQNRARTPMRAGPVQLFAPVKRCA